MYAGKGYEVRKRAGVLLVRLLFFFRQKGLFWPKACGTIAATLRFGGDSMFTGFTDETVDFLWGIRFNNERPWFEANKGAYLRSLYHPMRELGGELYDFLADKRPDQGLIFKVSRIYRDARRLFGRGPYKDHLWIAIEQPTEQWEGRPTFWFEVSPDGWEYGLGYWMPKPVVMAKLRARIDRDPDTMTELTLRLAQQEEFVLSSQDYKRPRAQAPSQLLQPWYQMKSFSIRHDDRMTEELFSRDIVDRVKKGYEFLLPYYDYFVTLKGDPEPNVL